MGNPSEAFEAVPFNRFLGLRLEDARDDGSATIRLAPRPEHTQENGVVHGGLISAVADTACVYAVLGRLPPENRITGIEFKINFLEPVVGEESVVATARPLRVGRRVAVAEATVRQGERLVAQGTFTYLRLE